MSIGRRTFLALISAAMAVPAFASDDTRPGRIEVLGDISFDGYPEARVRVWLPPGHEDSRARYRTLYMLDGQLAFADDSDGQNFAADSRVARLAAAGTIPPHVIVAIDNLGRDRFLQYMPSRSTTGPRATCAQASTASLRATTDERWCPRSSSTS